jgi:hypothetical protein
MNAALARLERNERQGEAMKRESAGRKGWGMYRITSAIVLVSLLAASGCKRAPAGCTSDNDCKGSRVCENGACVESPAPATAPQTTMPASEPQPAPPLPAPTMPAARTAETSPPGRGPTEPPVLRQVENNPLSSVAEKHHTFGRWVLKCFHPSTEYKGIALSDTYKDADGRTAQNGRIDFTGGLTGHGYTMDYVMHSKTEGGDKLTRITPTADTAFTKPSPTCALRDWTRTN